METPISRITDPDALDGRLDLTGEERGFFDRQSVTARLPFAVTPYYLELAEDRADDPIRRQFVPSEAELTTRAYELTDPLGEERFMPVPRLIHRYTDRALVLTTDSCAVHCRHCFRRRFTGSGRGAPTMHELTSIASYIESHAEIREVLLSGGDPLTLATPRLGELVDRLRSVRGDLVLRIATRVPVVAPDRVDRSVVELLAGVRPVWMVVQVNHPRELTAASESVLSSIVAAGVPVVTQTVLLRGVNDSVSVLESLFSRLVGLMVKPYYLFQGDLAPGTSHFRVSIDRGLSIMRELRRRISGLAMPVYAVDCPDGGGKVPLTEQYLEKRVDGWYILRAPDGTRYQYPMEDES